MYTFRMFFISVLLNFATGRNIPTCRSCVGKNSINNILPHVLNRGLLTSGYFSIFFSTKLTGKLEKSFVLVCCI